MLTVLAASSAASLIYYPPACYHALPPGVLILSTCPRPTPQLPNLEEIWWVSAIGAATSLCYCTIALILGCVYAGNGYGSVGGLPGSSTADKVFKVGGIRLPAGCFSAHATVAS